MQVLPLFSFLSWLTHPIRGVPVEVACPASSAAGRVKVRRNTGGNARQRRLARRSQVRAEIATT